MIARLILCVPIVWLASLSASHADTYTVEKTKKEVSATKTEIENLRHTIGTKAPPVQAEREQVRAEYNRLGNWQLNIDQRVHSYNAACAGRPVNASCTSTLSSIETEKSQYQSAVSAYTQRNNQVNQRSDEIIKLADRIKMLTARLQQLEATLQDATANACRNLGSSASDEQLKNLCGNVQFDGTSVGLPPCNTERCRAYDTLR